MIRYLLTIILISALFALPALGAPPAAERPKLIVGGDHENPPYEFLEDGKPTGFNIELIRAVAEVMGLDVEIRLGPWGKVRQDLEQGKIDALAGMYYSVERSRLVDFSLPHTMVSAGLFVRGDSPIRSIEDIKGKEVIVQKGDVIDDYLRERGLTSRIVEVTDPEDELRLLASGKHDSALMPSRFQGEYLKRSLGLANLRCIVTDLPQFRYCFAVRKGNSTLLYRLDEGLNILKVNGKYKEIYEKWFGIYEKKDLWQTLRYFVWALAVIAALLAANFIWSWSLRREVRKCTAELRESEEKFRVLTETSPSGIWLYQGERIVYVNPATARLLEYTEEECLGMRFWNWVHEDFKELVRERGMARQRGEPAPSQYECKHVTKSGKEKWTLVSAGLIEYRGKPAGIVTMFDITDRKRMEEDLQHAYDDLEKRVQERTEELAEAVTALRNSDAHYRAIVDTFDGLIYICSQDYRIEFMNNKLIERTGYEAVGELCFKVLHDRDSACPWCVNDRIFAGETVRWEMLSPKDNCWYYVVNVPVYHANGSISKHSMIMDITERKRAEEALRESEARLKIAMDLAKLGPWEYDVGTGLFTFDDQFYALYGTTVEREGGTLMPAEVYARRFIPPEDSAIVANGIAETQANSSIQLEHRIIRADGEERFIIVRAEAVFNQEGRFVKIRGANQDITERKLAEERLQRKREQLEELNRTLETRVQEEVAKNREKDIILIQQNRQAALGELMEHIAHQWKQPLNVINLIIFDLGETYSRGKLSDEQVKTTIDKIMELTEHMAQTINVFRDFYKPEKEKKAFRIKESIDRALSFVAPALRFHAIGVELDVDPELFALGYPKEYAQVLLNILANARDAFRNREAGNRLLKISAFAKENKAVVTLTDNGGGINPGIIDKICDIYFTTKESSGGAGVGLYMSKNIIEKNMGGTLSCRNVDQGAEFRIELSIPGDEKTGPCA